MVEDNHQPPAYKPPHTLHPAAPRPRRSLKTLMPVQPLPHFIVPRYGEVRFIPQGDVPLRDTRVWRVKVDLVPYPRRGEHAPNQCLFWYPVQDNGGAVPYPTVDTARHYMLMACAHADDKPVYTYVDAKELPPL